MSLFMRAKLLQTSQLTQPPNKLQTTTAMLNDIHATFKKQYIDCSKIIEWVKMKILPEWILLG